MNTRKYLYMVTIAECGYLSVAANRLGISQAALSKFLNGQEQFLSTELFVRYKKRLYPTAAGLVYLEAANQILSTKNRTLSSINRLNDSPIRTLRAAFTPYRGAALFSRVYNKFEACFPNIELQLEETFSSEQELKIHQGLADFALGVNCHANYSDICNLAVCREELVLTVPSFHPLAKYAGSDLQHLVSLPLRMFWDTPFCLPSKKNNIRIVAENLFEKAGFFPVIAFESDNGMTVDSMIRQGTGVGFISRRYVRPDENVVYFRLDPYCYEVTYLRYSVNRILSKIDCCLCGLTIQERLTSKHHTLIRSDQVKAFLNCLPGNDFLEVEKSGGRKLFSTE